MEGKRTSGSPFSDRMLVQVRRIDRAAHDLSSWSWELLVDRSGAEPLRYVPIPALHRHSEIVRSESKPDAKMTWSPECLTGKNENACVLEQVDAEVRNSDVRGQQTR